MLSCTTMVMLEPWERSKSIPALLPVTVLFRTVRLAMFPLLAPLLELLTCRPVAELLENVFPSAALAPPIVPVVRVEAPRICISMPSPPGVPVTVDPVIKKLAMLVSRLSTVIP